MRGEARQHTRGFTLIELVVVIVVVSALAALAVPRFISIAHEARLASLKTMAAAVTGAADQVHLNCRFDPICDYTNIYQYVTIDGRGAYVDFGWPNAGDSLHGGQIDDWVDSVGYTAKLDGSGFRTVFTLDDAPDPDQCAVVYEEASFNAPTYLPTITQRTSGC